MAEKTATLKAKADPMAPALDRADMEELPRELKAAQTAAQGGKVKAVPLVARKSAHGEPDPGPPTSPAAAASPAPRVVHQNERVPKGSGLTRFKIRCLNYGGGDQPTRYVLAADRASAEKTYLAHTGLQAVLDLLTDKDGNLAGPVPKFATKALED